MTNIHDTIFNNMIKDVNVNKTSEHDLFTKLLQVLKTSQIVKKIK